MKEKSKTLLALIKRYETMKELSAVYVEQLIYSVKRFAKFLGRKALVKDLTPKRVNRWLKHESELGQLADRTRSNLRRTTITLWRFSGRKLKLKSIRNVKVAKRNPPAWSIEEFTKFVGAAERLRGKLPNGVPKSLYFRTIIWFGLETGLRRSDIWAFDPASIGEDGRAAITQHKTNNAHVVQLSKLTVEAINKMVGIITERGADACRPLRWPKSQSQFYYWMRRLRELSGVDPGVVNRCLQHLRRTGATLIALDGGIPYQYLGHTKPGLDLKHYVDGVKTTRVQIPSFNHDQAA